MLTETLKINLKNIQDDSILIYLLNNEKLNVKLYGLTTLEWVKKAINDFPFVEFNYDNTDLVRFLKPKLVNSKYIIVLFSSTPLLTTPSLIKIMEYVKVKQIKALQFTGGYAFDVNYLKNVDKVIFDNYLPIDNEDFLVVDNQNKLNAALKILKSRIIQKHINNGVEFVGDSEIDEQVVIGKNAVIFSGNVIKGNSEILDNTILKENNIIEHCKIGKDVCISCSNLINSVIEDNVFILPYCYVNNSTIRKNCYISSGIKVENRTVRAGSKLKEN